MFNRVFIIYYVSASRITENIYDWTTEQTNYQTTYTKLSKYQTKKLQNYQTIKLPYYQANKPPNNNTKLLLPNYQITKVPNQRTTKLPNLQNNKLPNYQTTKPAAPKLTNSPQTIKLSN